MKYPVFDLHCDTALALLGQNLRSCGSLCKNQGHIDLERASELAGYAQCFACFTTTALDDFPEKVDPTALFEREMATVMREIERNSDRISLAYSAKDIKTNLAAGRMSAVLTIEGPAGFGYDPELLEDLYCVGFRITTLGWNESNVLAGSHVTGGGLTELGESYVKKAQSLGMIIDVSHISDEAFWDIIRIAQGPVIASHSNSRAVCDHSRNITDEMFEAICKTDGVVGINLYKDFLGEAADLDTVCRHIEHFAQLDPDCRHIALGGDLDGCDALPEGFTGIQDYNKLAQRLEHRGMSEDHIRNIFWNNAVGVIECCI